MLFACLGASANLKLLYRLDDFYLARQTTANYVTRSHPSCTIPTLQLRMLDMVTLTESMSERTTMLVIF